MFNDESLDDGSHEERAEYLEWAANDELWEMDEQARRTTGATANLSEAKPKPVRDLTRSVYEAVRYDCWPSSAGRVDFGLRTTKHLAFLRHSIIWGGVTLQELDAVLANGEALTDLCRRAAPNSPHAKDTVFVTEWDLMGPDPDGDE